MMPLPRYPGARFACAGSLLLLTACVGDVISVPPKGGGTRTNTAGSCNIGPINNA